MTSMSPADAIAPQDPSVIESEKKEKEQFDEKQPDIEYADVPAVVDVHGEVIKADWHTIRAKANDAEEYEHSLGLWQAMKSYKKARRAFCQRKPSLTLAGPILVVHRLFVHNHGGL